MNQSKQMKMENPIRVAELNPVGTLRKIGLGEYDAVCDIGAGSGIFAEAAAGITKNKVYALEIDETMLDVISAKANRMHATNIETIKVDGEKLELQDQTADLVLMVTVLHEIENTSVFLKEVKRLLKKGGRILVIEFHKRETPMGPPVSNRMSGEEVKKILGDFGFSVADEFNLGDNLYCLIFN